MSNLSGFVKRLRDIMRNDAGINGDAQRIEQIAWMLFLKVYDAKEQDWEFDDEDYVVIQKISDSNKSLICSILESDWLLKINELDEMSTELVESKKNTLECQLRILKEDMAKYPHLKFDDRIKLLEYKLECLDEYLVDRKGKVMKKTTV